MRSKQRCFACIVSCTAAEFYIKEIFIIIVSTYLWCPCCLCTELYVAIYTYMSDEVGDLTFNEGDVISVSRTDGEWWTGSIGYRSGIFPGNFVKKYEERHVIAANVEEVGLQL